MIFAVTGNTRSHDLRQTINIMCVDAKAVEYQRDVVPMYFEGKNSMLFYRLARLRKRLGVKFNFEQILLPREMMKCRGKEFVLHIGKPIGWAQLQSRNPSAEAERIKHICYGLGKA